MNKYYLLILISTGITFTAKSQIVNQATALANETISMMGGIQNFEATRYIGWTFFDKRQLLWDKQENIVRVDLLKRRVSIIASLTDNSCVLFLNGVRENHPDSLSKYLDLARLYWMNDTYWLLMPFKLLDDGVILSYAGKGITADGRDAEILQLTFENVGATPENKYRIYIDSETRLVSQWEYFDNAEDENPAIVNPWTDYNWYGKILLASGRGDRGNISNIHVWNNLDISVFGSSAIPDFNNIK